MTNTHSKKKNQLGIDPGTASSRLKKILLFNFACNLGFNTCHKCGSLIESVEEFSIEHKIPWMDSENPKELFFDLENIAFSHLKCNKAYDGRSKKGRNISFDKSHRGPNKWRAKYHQGLKKQFHIGWFMTEEDADRAFSEFIKSKDFKLLSNNLIKK